jgi:hypothetical protein
MIGLTRKAITNDPRVTFRLGTHDSIPEGQQFNVVILFCFLDLFSDEQLYEIIRKVELSIKPHALWLVTDFVETRWWHSLLLFIMYRFFRWTTGLKTQNLPVWHDQLLRARLVMVDEIFFGYGFIKSALYTK